MSTKSLCLFAGVFITMCDLEAQREVESLSDPSLSPVKLRERPPRFGHTLWDRVVNKLELNGLSLKGLRHGNLPPFEDSFMATKKSANL